MTNVLLAIDGPLYGKVIEDFVVNHRWVKGTKFKLVHFIEPVSNLEAHPDGRFALKDCEHQNNELLKDLATQIASALPDTEVTFEVTFGIPKEEILAESLGWPAHMIVIGSHGRKGIQRFLLGSVSQAVIMQAPCSVILIRLPETVDEKKKPEAEVANAAH